MPVLTSFPSLRHWSFGSFPIWTTLVPNYSILKSKVHAGSRTQRCTAKEPQPGTTDGSKGFAIYSTSKLPNDLVKTVIMVEMEETLTQLQPPCQLHSDPEVEQHWVDKAQLMAMSCAYSN